MDGIRHKNWVFGRDGALFRAASIGDAKLLAWLAEAGGNVKIASPNGFTPLHRAAEHGHLEVVQFLLDKGANPLAAAADKSTPISLAEAGGHKKIVQLLRKHRI